jgi:sulfite exporter TauE/SafE
MPHSHDLLSAAGGGLDLLAFVTLGLLGGAAHCVGMCAPFVLLVSRRYAAPAGAHAPAAAQLWYSIGRLITYAALGGLAGALGSQVQRAGALVGLQRGAAVLAGLLLIVSAVSSLRAWAAAARGVTRVVGRLSAAAPGHPLSLGLLLGLLPCGLLYSAVVAAVAPGHPVRGAAALAAFGLGTTPGLVGIAVVDRLVLGPRPALSRLSQAFVLVMGVYYLWRGVAPLWEL